MGAKQGPRVRPSGPGSGVTSTLTEIEAQAGEAPAQGHPAPSRVRLYPVLLLNHAFLVFYGCLGWPLAADVKLNGSP